MQKSCKVKMDDTRRKCIYAILNEYAVSITLLTLINGSSTSSCLPLGLKTVNPSPSLPPSRASYASTGVGGAFSELPDVDDTDRPRFLLRNGDQVSRGARDTAFTRASIRSKRVLILTGPGFGICRRLRLWGCSCRGAMRVVSWIPGVVYTVGEILGRDRVEDSWILGGRG